MDKMLEVNKLNKKYLNKVALNNVDLSLAKGKVLGLLGPNGSGKTTLIKILAGILQPTAGEVKIDGKEPGIATKAIVSYLPDRNYLYKWMKVRDAIAFFDDMYPDFDRHRAEELIGFMKLEMNSKVTALSKGMVEKLNLTLVLSRKAKLYIIDEPIAGVDPVARDQILGAILENYHEDSAMIITTHLVQDIERLFDEVAFINEGNIVLTGNAESLRMEHEKSIDALFREVFGK